MAQARIVTIESQQGDEVEYQVDGETGVAFMEGFPPGFTLRPGERAMHLPDRGVVLPLVGSVVLKPGPDVTRGATVSTAARKLVVPEHAMIAGDPSHERVVWFIDPGKREGPPQVVASRNR